VCAAGEDVSKTVCELCSNTGGAYKSVEKSGKWVHSLCSTWIPEIYSMDIQGETVLTLKELDRKRFKLKCVLCTGKGACIQCSYGKCCIPAHPWCILHTPKGFTRRVIKDEDDQMVWDIFCKAHATAVSEPLKPKAKQKITTQIVTAPVVDLSEEKFKSRKGDRRDTKLQYSMSHSVRRTSVPKGGGDASNDSLSGRDDSSETFKKKKKPRSRDSDDDNDESDESQEDEEVVKIVRASKTLKRKDDGAKNGRLHASPLQKIFPVLTLVEWPGQAEGEAMDLDHFWNVAAMHYPEDHTMEVRPVMVCVDVITDG
jgi:PHD-zinc-finger like domain